MTTDVLALADALWRGERTIEEIDGPMRADGSLAEISDGAAFLWGFANVTAVTNDAGLLLVDTGSRFTAARVHEAIRSWTPAPLLAAVFSHGHVDHVFGVEPFEAAGDSPVVYAHENMPARFERYVLTAGYNAHVNARQFGVAGLEWPTEYRFPDATYRDTHTMTLGDEPVELHHARGETDDHTWTWFPRRRLLCSGDLFIWASPNAGNPQKVQRYPREWAAALREMATLGAEVLLPGHGVPVAGAHRIREALTDTAALLESLVEQTLALMNAGARLDDLIHTVRAPEDLLAKPYLKPVYDEPEFVVRNIWRLYGGWYDGNPATLKPAADAAVAREVADLAGGARVLARRALATEDPRLACHLAEMAALADPDDAEVHRARAEVYARRVAGETSLMAKGIYRAAAEESRARESNPAT